MAGRPLWHALSHDHHALSSGPQVWCTHSVWEACNPEDLEAKDKDSPAISVTQLGPHRCVRSCSLALSAMLDAFKHGSFHHLNTSAPQMLLHAPIPCPCRLKGVPDPVDLLHAQFESEVLIAVGAGMGDEEGVPPGLRMSSLTRAQGPEAGQGWAGGVEAGHRSSRSQHGLLRAHSFSTAAAMQVRTLEM